MLRELIAKNKRKVVIASTILLLFVICGLSVYAIYGGTEAFQKEQAVGNFETQVRVAPQTKIQQIYEYRLCKDEKTETSFPSAELIGLEYGQFEQVYPGWEIAAFTETEVKLILPVDDFCPWHKNHRFIGEKDGVVAIYCGKPDDRPVLTQQTDVQLSSLHPQVAEEIKQGLRFENKEEMLRLLEGIQSR